MASNVTACLSPTRGNCCWLLRIPSNSWITSLSKFATSSYPALHSYVRSAQPDLLRPVMTHWRHFILIHLSASYIFNGSLKSFLLKACKRFQGATMFKIWQSYPFWDFVFTPKCSNFNSRFLYQVWQLYPMSEPCSELLSLTIYVPVVPQLSGCHARRVKKSWKPLQGDKKLVICPRSRCFPPSFVQLTCLTVQLPAAGGWRKALSSCHWISSEMSDQSPQPAAALCPVSCFVSALVNPGR